MAKVCDSVTQWIAAAKVEGSSDLPHVRLNRQFAKWGATLLGAFFVVPKAVSFVALWLFKEDFTASPRDFLLGFVALLGFFIYCLDHLSRVEALDRTMRTRPR